MKISGDIRCNLYRGTGSGFKAIITVESSTRIPSPSHTSGFYIADFIHGYAGFDKEAGKDIRRNRYQ